ncbi:MAG: major tail protein [Saccharofermentanales bacterium]
MNNIVKFGLSNVNIFPITSVTEGVITYGTGFVLPGAVDLALNATGSETPFRADNITYYLAKSNDGYSGSLEIAKIIEAFETQILGMQKDTKNVMVEAADDISTEFGMTFQIEGDTSGTKLCFYRCNASRPGINAKTQEETIVPDTDVFDLRVMPRYKDKYIRAKCESGSSAYTTFEKSIYEPTFTPAGG